MNEEEMARSQRHAPRLSDFFRSKPVRIATPLTRTPQEAATRDQRTHNEQGRRID